MPSGETAPSHPAPLLDHLPDDPSPDTLLLAFLEWADARELTLYPHQEEAILALFSGDNVVLATPTGSGKSMVALAGAFAMLAQGRRTVYTAPIKALVSEKFFEIWNLYDVSRTVSLSRPGPKVSSEGFAQPRPIVQTSPRGRAISTPPLIASSAATPAPPSEWPKRRNGK